jgi:hypothetical protein
MSEQGQATPPTLTPLEAEMLKALRSLTARLPKRGRWPAVVIHIGSEHRPGSWCEVCTAIAKADR